MHGKHGKSVETEVPRSTLVEELKNHSHYYTTEEIQSFEKPYFDVVIEID
jgi:hypothetical protein